MPVDLDVGKPVLGWFIDGDETTPEVAVNLEDTGDQILLTVPLKGMGGLESPYSRWFGWGTSYGDDPDRTKYSYAPPSICMYYDHRGTVVLVGCHARSANQGFDGGVGRIEADYAIVGGSHLNYAAINGVRVDFPALAPWTKMRSVHIKTESDPRGRANKLHMTLESPPNVSLARRMNLTLHPTWRTSYPDKVGTFSAHDVVQLMTATKSARDWRSHFDPIAAMRALLVLSSWTPLGFAGIAVNRGDDPTRVLSGDVIGERWSDVLTHKFPKHEDWDQSLGFLFYFDDIGTRGVHRWLNLASRFERGLRPLLSIADQKTVSLETAIVECGIALEALGHQIALDRNRVKPGRTNQLSHEGALELILDELVYFPFSDSEKWKTQSNRVYKGVKHADNAKPSFFEMREVLRADLLVFRCWVASRLGVTADVLRKRVEGDVMNR